MYYQPAFCESGEFAYSQEDMFYGSRSTIAELEYRKIFDASSFYLGASLFYQIPSFGDVQYSMKFVDSPPYFKHASLLGTQV